MADSRNTQAIMSMLLEQRQSAKASVLKEDKTTKKKAVVKEKKETKVVTESTPSASFLKRVYENLNPVLEDEGINDDVMDDVIDNVHVVVDPEKNVDDLEVRADAVQDAIEDAPDGEEAFSDEYVGDTIYACPICGESFFADDAYQEGDMCPICKAEPTGGFLNQGVVATTEEAVEETDVEGQEVEGDEGEVEDIAEVEPTIDEEGEAAAEDEDDVKEEGKECDDDKDVIEEGIDCDYCEDGDCDDTCELVECGDTYADIDLDEESLEGLLSEFLEENYGSSVEDSMVTKCKYAKKDEAIVIEGMIKLKNGKKRPFGFELKEAKYANGKAILEAAEKTGAFNMVEGKEAPFRFNVSRNKKTIVFESMIYKFVSNHPKAGKVVVEGTASKKSKKSKK